MTEKGLFKKRFTKGLVMVGQPNEVGWYEQEGYKDKQDDLIVDETVVLKKETVLKAIDEAKKEFEVLIPIETKKGMYMGSASLIDSSIVWKKIKKWFGE